MVKKIILYMLVGIIITAGPLYYVNNILLADTGSGAGAAVELPTLFKPRVAVPLNAEYLALAFNKEYVCYVENGIIYIKDASKGEVYSTVKEGSPITYAMAMEDRQIIMYFTYDGGKLDIKTYNIDSSEKTDQKSIDVKNLQRIRDVKYSSLTNVIYIDAEISSGKGVFDRVYRVDIMKHVSVYTDNKNIVGMALLKNRDTFVYQDTKNNVYIRGRMFAYKNNKAFKLLGTDKDDNIYVSPVGSPGEVFVVKDGSVKNTIQVDDSYNGSMSKDGTVYLQYKDYMLDIAYNRQIKIKPGTEVVDVVSGSMLILDDKNNAAIEKAS